MFTLISRRTLTVGGLLLCTVASAALAQISLDGTLSPARPLPGPNYAITADLGRQVGGNLFHSFGLFSIHRGESATFSGPNSVNNIISRVTGGQASTIDGALRSTIPGANLYLLNPSGVLFGEHAQLDVPGSVHVSTAAELRLSDGAAFSAASPGISTLSVAPPEAFGFLGPNRGEIRIEGSQLTFTPGRRVTLSAGDITVQDSLLLIECGDLVLTAMGDATGLAPINSVLAGEAQGRLTIENVQWDEENPLGLWVSGDGGGGVWLRGGETRLRNAAIIADNWGTRDATRGVDLEAASLTLDNSLISSDALDIGHGGNVSLGVREDLRLLNGGIVSASAFGAGHAGDITISARNLLLTGGSQESLIASNAYEGSTGHGGQVRVTVAETLGLQAAGDISASTGGEGDAGDITVRAGTLWIDGQGIYTGITSNAYKGSTGDGGSISVEVADDLTLLNGGEISASTSGAGDAGDMTVTARHLLVAGGSLESGITSSAYKGSTGDGGTIHVTVAETLALQAAGDISASTWGEGNAGDITVRAGTLWINGQGVYTGITSDAYESSAGDGGPITVEIAGDLTLLNGGVISASAFSTGDAGDMTVAARNLRVAGGSRESVIASSAYESSTGHGGHVRVTVAETLALQADGHISASTWGEGNAGNITVRAGTLWIDGQGAFTGITSQAYKGSTGDGGSVTIEVADDLTLLNGGEIGTSTFGAGAAGDMTVAARNLLLAGGSLESVITSSAYEGSSGRGGAIHLTVADTLALQPNGFISASTFGLGDAGDIIVRAGTLSIDSQAPENFASIAVLAGPDAAGDIGHITIHADTLRLLNGGQINAESNATRLIDAAPRPDARLPNLQITARDLELSNGSRITSEASGNTPAGDISLQIGERLTLDQSRITTEAYDGDGGAITLNGGTLLLRDSQITTSVFGIRGNGGDITLTPNALVLDGGFIQANTAAASAKGGDIRIATPVLLTPADQELLIGGQTEETFQPGVNVIQAAAPDGVSGAVQVAPPTLNLSSNLVVLNTAYLDAAAQLSPRCGTGDPEERSRFIIQGRGNWPPDPGDALTVNVSRCRAVTDSLSQTTPPEPLMTAEIGFGDR